MEANDFYHGRFTIDPENYNFDGDLDDAGNGKGVLTTKNDDGQVTCVTEVISPIFNRYVTNVKKEVRECVEVESNMSPIFNGQWSCFEGGIRGFRFDGMVTETVPAETRTRAMFRAGRKSGLYRTATVDNVFQVRGSKVTPCSLVMREGIETLASHKFR